MWLRACLYTRGAMVAYCAWVFVLFLVFLPSTGFSLSNTCTETFPINYKYFIRPLLFWKMRMISKANTHPVCLPVWIILFLRPSLPLHLSPQHCKEICSIEYWWTELYYGFFLFFFSFFFLRAEKKPNANKHQLFFVHNPVNFFKYLSLFFWGWVRKKGRTRERKCSRGEWSMKKKPYVFPFLHPCEFDAYRVALVNVYKNFKCCLYR